MSQNNRLLLASVLSIIILLVWDAFFIPKNRYKPVKEGLQISESNSIQQATRTTQEIEITTTEPANIFNNMIDATARGMRIETAMLKKYRVENSDSSPNVQLLLNQKLGDKQYFLEFGWLNAGDTITQTPSYESSWKKDSENSFVWTNPQGVTFRIKYNLDDEYGFNVEQSVQNNSGREIQLSTYALINRSQNTVDASGNFILHEGPIGFLDNAFKEFSYESANKTFEDAQWAGFSDKYWLTALIPQGEYQETNFSSYRKKYQIDMLSKVFSVPSSNKHISKIIAFVGAKEIEALEHYEKDYNLSFFDNAVDFGVLYFITKPLFLLLHWLNKYIGNFGWSIIALTLIIKISLSYISFKGYRSMQKMRELAPKMEQLKQKYGSDAVKMQQEMVKMYREEGASPFSGCLPILIQMPIFFALYKVLYVTIEMRHAPFIWFITDLSAQDPTNIFNLFGLIPWDPFISLGILPILMSVTIYIQQSFSPKPTDPTQALMLKMMPWVFLFLFASFPSGLLTYWIFSNIISILQQLVIKKYYGV